MTLELLFSGVVGALIVFVLGLLREWWREEREREGLLRLLLAEIDHNAEVVRTIREETWDLLSSRDFRLVRTDTWRDVQGRVAALLPDEMSAALNSYYSPLQTLLTLRSFGESAKRRFIRDLKRKYTKQTGEEVPASRNPWKEYQDETLDAQERARERILAYLSLPWDDRLILRLRQWVNKRWQRSSREES